MSTSEAPHTSRLILGTMGLGTSTDLGREREIALAAVQTAISVGITTIDLADIYSQGRSEQVFGEVLRMAPGLRDSVSIQTKCGIDVPTENSSGRYDFARASIVRKTEASLTRLGIDTIDTLLLHRPDPLMEPDEVAAAFVDLHDAGKVAAFGVSNMSSAQMEFLRSALPFPLVVNQLEMSLGKLAWIESTVLVNDSAGAGVNFPHGTLEYCRSNGVELQAWAPLAQGRFSGGRNTGSGADDAAAAMVAEMAKSRDTSPEAIVLGWIMRHPARIRPVIGTTNPGRITACAEADQQAALMTGDEWYRLWIAARGASMP